MQSGGGEIVISVSRLHWTKRLSGSRRRAARTAIPPRMYGLKIARMRILDRYGRRWDALVRLRLETGECDISHFRPATSFCVRAAQVGRNFGEIYQEIESISDTSPTIVIWKRISFISCLDRSMGLVDEDDAPQAQKDCDIRKNGISQYPSHAFAADQNMQ